MEKAGAHMASASASAVPMGRGRGSLSGVALILLGAWGGLVPFIGPYFSFCFEPDKPWTYTAARLYLSALPGAAALLGGLLISITKVRGLPSAAAIIAALGGAWFVVGQLAIAIL